jgi:hypothetical protein
MMLVKFSPLLVVALTVACGGGDKPAATAGDGAGASSDAGSSGSGTASGGSGTSGSSTSGGSDMSDGGALSSGGTMPGGGVGHAGMPPTSVAEGTPGEWVNVTPPGIKLGQNDVGGMDNYGVQDVLADPARPGDLYAFVCYQGLWRSTDYGTTWTQVNKGDNWGKPWGSAIDPNPNRDPTVAPTIYAGVSGALGFLKSVDFGKTFSTQKMPDSFGDYHYQEVYSVDIDPYDVNHALVGFHEQADAAETTDGGSTWKKRPTPPGDDGGSYYPFFIDTGDAATTGKTWLVIPQEASTAYAVQTTDGGATWKKLGKFQHHHGSAQIFSPGKGVVYMVAMQPSGIQKSTDSGATWKQLRDISDGVITGSDKLLYVSVGKGWGSKGEPLDPEMGTAPLTDDGNWTAMMAPSGMFDGSKRIAVTKDKSHNIIVAGNWHAGIWRYIEP